MDLIKIIDVFIPTLEYCSIIVKFVEPKWSNMIIYRGKDYYNILYKSKEHEEASSFETPQELKIKFEYYLEKYKVKTIEIEGSIGPPTYIYNP
jgi:hypothetical protein